MARFILIPLLAVLLFPGRALGGQWRLDLENSSIGFSVIQIGGVRVDGDVPSFSARICFEERDLAGTRAQIALPLASLTTGVRERDEILHAPEWLASQSHPDGGFELTSLERLGPNSYQAAGTLSLKGAARKVTFPLTISLGEERAHGALTIDRRDFNIGEGPWGETEKWVAFPISISFDIAARPTGEPCND